MDDIIGSKPGAANDGYWYGYFYDGIASKPSFSFAIFSGHVLYYILLYFIHISSRICVQTNQ